MHRLFSYLHFHHISIVGNLISCVSMLVSPLPVLSFPLAWRSRRPLNRKPKKTTGWKKMKTNFTTQEINSSRNRKMKRDKVNQWMAYLLCFPPSSGQLTFARSFLFISNTSRRHTVEEQVHQEQVLPEQPCDAFIDECMK